MGRLSASGITRRVSAGLLRAQLTRGIDQINILSIFFPKTLNQGQMSYVLSGWRLQQLAPNRVYEVIGPELLNGVLLPARS